MSFYEPYTKQSSSGRTEARAGKLMRLEAPLYFTDLPLINLKSFAIVDSLDSRNNQQTCLLLHYLNKLIFFSPRASSIIKEIQCTYAQRNIVRFDSRIYLWEDKGTTIEKLELPFKKSSQFTTTVYTAKNCVKYCKKIKSNKGKDTMIVCDENKYLKVIHYEKAKDYCKLERTYYIHNNFAVNETLAALEKYQFNDGLLYMQDKVYLCQMTEDTCEDICINLSSSQMLSTNNSVLSVSSDYLLMHSKPSHKHDGEIESSTIYLCPPSNCRQVKLSNMHDELITQYFLSSDERQLVSIYKSQERGVTTSLTKLNGTVVDTQNMFLPTNLWNSVQVSESGKYVCQITLEDQVFRAEVKHIDYDQISDQLIIRDGPLEANIIPGSYHLDDEFSDMIFDSEISNMFKWKLLNNGDYVGLSFKHNCFFVNGKNQYPQLSDLLAKNLNTLETTDGGHYPIDVNKIIISEDYVVAYAKNIMFSFMFDSETGRISNVKKVDHEIIDDLKFMRLESIAPTIKNDYFLIKYTMESTTTIIVWDLVSNSEVNSFTSRSCDKYRGYAFTYGLPKVPEGVNNSLLSNTGYLLFDKYYVNLDNCVPVPTIALPNEGS